MSKQKQVPVNPAFSHMSHGLGDHATGHAVSGNIARDGAPKRIAPIIYSGGIRTISKVGVALGGDHKSALDSLSGLSVVPGAIKTAPGYGNAGVQSGGGNPLARPSGSKQLTRVAPAFGMKVPHGDDLHELGAAVLAEAASNKRGKLT